MPKTTKQSKRRTATARRKLSARIRRVVGRGRDLGDVRLQFLLGAKGLLQQ
jgi:hypothetical protein